MSDRELIEFLQWCLPRLQLQWPGFRMVRRTVRKRLIRRMRELGVSNLTAYRQRLETSPAEWDVLDGMSRIPISRFYRDKYVYDMLADSVLPECARRTGISCNGKVRILSAGCASGEEPYSVSLVWHLRIADSFPDRAIDILAADVDELMLKRAKDACYSSGSLKDLPHDLMQSGLERRRDAWCVLQRFRACVRFVQCDLRKCVPDGPFDLVLCRNTAFTYFDATTQARVAAQMHTALRSGGYLVIGTHETIAATGHQLVQQAPGCPIFRKSATAS